ncbi:MAG TPA: hypothetical protein VGV59_17175 [Pyrinomonadaceae bacterium]|nr:hypothetical protein [Pyrinomonadaceae bacterium]
MAQTATAVGNMNTATGTTGANKDVAESMLRDLDQTTKKTAGVSLFHILTLGSIGASIALFIAGKKSAAIFVGLWPPTFQALKSVADTNKENRK